MATKKNSNHRFQIQAISLAVSLLAPFGIYSALQAGNAIAAAIFFALLTLAMGIVVVKG